MDARAVDRWLVGLGLDPAERAERDGVTSWDLLLDGHRRRDIRVTLILDPALALVCWVHYAPPINDSFRVSYRKLLRWNDELLFVKFAVSPDERPVLITELPATSLGERALGVALLRLLLVCDLLLDESLAWLHPGAKRAPVPVGRPRNAELLARHSGDLAELAAAVEGLLAPDPDPEPEAR